MLWTQLGFQTSFSGCCFYHFWTAYLKIQRPFSTKKNNNKAPVIGRSKIKKICAWNVQQQTNFSNMLNKWHCQVFNKRTCLTKCCWFVRLILLFTSRHAYDLVAVFSYQFKIFRRKQFCHRNCDHLPYQWVPISIIF